MVDAVEPPEQRSANLPERASLVSRGCIEERIAAVVADKHALFRGVFEGSNSEVKVDRSGSLLQVLERLAPEVPDAPAVESDPISRTANIDLVAAAPPSEVEELVAAADPRVGADDVLHPDGAGAVRELFAALKVERAADGAVHIEAPPLAARALMALFEGMARLMDSSPGAPRAASSNGAASEPVSAAP